MFKVSNKDTRMAPYFMCFSPFSIISIVDFEQVNICLEPADLSFMVRLLKHKM